MYNHKITIGTFKYELNKVENNEFAEVNEKH